MFKNLENSHAHTALIDVVPVDSHELRRDRETLSSGTQRVLNDQMNDSVTRHIEYSNMVVRGDTSSSERIALSLKSSQFFFTDTAPELHYTFIEQALHPGPSLALHCAASGSPPPRFTWLLDAQAVEEHNTPQRYYKN